MFRKIIVASLVIFLLVLALITFEQYQKARDLRIPVINKLSLPPFEEQIIKDGNNYLVLFQVPKQQYEGKYMIGNSNVDLEPYVGKKVKTIRDATRVPKGGGYPIMSSVQCIRKVCHSIFKDNPTQKTEVIDIKDIIVLNSKADPS